jgi:SAM-dependent MidA family methyltransferase
MQYEQPASLPTPDELSATHSARVVDHLRAKIAATADRRISFAEFMHEALYAPGLGYYSAGSTKFGADGDFTTAPAVSSVFAKVLARQTAELLRSIGAHEILEIGAGSGKLAADMLIALENLDALPATYNILEVSPDLQDRQQKRLREDVPQLFDRIKWLPDLPQNFDGVIVANEVLDALPVTRFVRRETGVFEYWVTLENEEFGWAEVPATEQLASAVAAIEIDLGEQLADGYTSEVSLAAPHWIADLAKSLRQGAILFFDYGVSRREYYAADRSDGWLRCHFRHHAHNNPLLYPGIQDLTAWVDFSLVADAAVRNELQIIGYQTQSHFLMGGGLEIEMQGFEELPLAKQLELSGQIKTLTLPGEMGENFKCIALGRGEFDTPSAFEFADRTQTL